MAKEKKAEMTTASSDEQSSQLPKQPRIVSQPTAQQLSPSDIQKQRMNSLFAWEKLSSETQWVVGQPINPVMY